MNKTRKQTLVFLWILSRAALVKADTEEIFQFYQEEAKVVTASKRAEKIEEAPAIVSVVTAEEIERYGANTLAEVLQRMPSVYMAGSYLFPTNVVSIRGDLDTHTNFHVLFLINGRPFRESYAGGWDFPILTSFPIDVIERIEMVRGPGSVLYGTNAYDGVINIITKEAKEKKEGNLAIGAGSFGTQHYQASGGGTFFDGLSAYGGVNYLSSKGWDFTATDERRVTQTTQYGQEDLGLTLFTKYKGFTFDTFYAEPRYENLGQIPFWPSGTVRSDRWFSDLGYKHALIDRWQASLNFTSNYFWTQWDNQPGAPKTFTDPSAASYLTEVTVNGQPWNNTNVVFGGVGNYQENGPATPNSNDIPPTPSFSYTWWSSYLQADYKPVSFLKLVGGAQWNKAEGVPANVSPRASAIVDFSDQWGSKILYGEAFRSAYPNETLTSVPGVVQGNPTLDPEKIYTTEGQIFYHTPRLQTSVGYFYSEQRGLIGRVPIPGSTAVTFANQNELISRGIEWEGKVFVLTHLSLEGSYLYQTNTNANGLNDTTFMPNNMFKAGFSYDPQTGISLGIFNSYFGNRADVSTFNPTVLNVNPPTESYNWLTAKLTFDLDKLTHSGSGHSTTLSLYAENLLNKPVYDPEYNRLKINTLPAQPGRSYNAELRYKFGGRK